MLSLASRSYRVLPALSFRQDTLCGSFMAPALLYTSLSALIEALPLALTSELHAQRYV